MRYDFSCGTFWICNRAPLDSFASLKALRRRLFSVARLFAPRTRAVLLTGVSCCVLPRRCSRRTSAPLVVSSTLPAVLPVVSTTSSVMCTFPVGVRVNPVFSVGALKSRLAWLLRVLALVPVCRYEPSLLHIKGKRNTRTKQVPVHVSSLNQGDAFVLDLGLKLFLVRSSILDAYPTFEKGVWVTAGLR